MAQLTARKLFSTLSINAKFLFWFDLSCIKGKDTVINVNGMRTSEFYTYCVRFFSSDGLDSCKNFYDKLRLAYISYYVYLVDRILANSNNHSLKKNIYTIIAM